MPNNSQTRVSRAPASTQDGTPQMTVPSSTNVAQLLANADASLTNAQKQMEATKKTIDKNTSKESKDKAILKAKEIVNAMLDPAYQVSKVLEFLGTIGGPLSPCATVGSALATLVTFEKKRQDHDIRILALHVELTQMLYTLAKLPPSFKDETSLADRLGSLIDGPDGVCKTMKDFGGFCDAFYGAGKIKRFIQTNTNDEVIVDYKSKFDEHRKSILELISHQTLVLASAHKAEIQEVRASLALLEKSLKPLCEYFERLTISKEVQAKQLVKQSGGVEALQMNEVLLKQFAEHLGVQLTPRELHAAQEPTNQYLERCSDAFELRYQFALERRITESKEAILNELKSGAYEYIADSMMRDIWKNTARNETTIKRRRFMDALNYHLKSVAKVFNHGSPDAWTKVIITRVHFHAAICDAIDDDASGYISVEELNDFMRSKPAKWTVPQWIAFWGYGWDSCNYEYRIEIIRIIEFLDNLRQKSTPNAEQIGNYLEMAGIHVHEFVDNPEPLHDLEPEAAARMEQLCQEWTSKTKADIFKRLKTANFNVDYDSVEALAGSERVEMNILPLLMILLHKHRETFSSDKVVSEDDCHTMAESVDALLTAIHVRIDTLARIWRRQRIDIDSQFEYYANGLLNNYYKVHRLIEKQIRREEEEEFEMDYMDDEESEEEDDASVAPEDAHEDGTQAGHATENEEEDSVARSANTRNNQDESQANMRKLAQHHDEGEDDDDQGARVRSSRGEANAEDSSEDDERIQRRRGNTRNGDEDDDVDDDVDDDDEDGEDEDDAPGDRGFYGSRGANRNRPTAGRRGWAQDQDQDDDDENEDNED